MTTKYRLINQRAQPLELHLPSRVVVIAPQTEIELSEAEASTPQITSLVKRRYISVRALQPTASTPPEKPKRKRRSS
jgi:hypothetical protein